MTYIYVYITLCTNATENTDSQSERRKVVVYSNLDSIKSCLPIMHHTYVLATVFSIA